MTDQPPRVTAAALWMLGAVGAFSLMAVAGRTISTELDTFEIMMYRSFVGVITVLIAACALGKLTELPTRKAGLHLGRNIAHFTGQNLWFYALTVIPLAQVFALEFTSPLWVLVLSPLLLGERLGPVRVFAAVLGFVGILIVTRPSADTINSGTVAAALSAIGFALSLMATKRLTQTESLTSILFWMTAMQAVMGLVCAGADLELAWPSRGAAPWLVVIGLCGLVAHFCITRALSMAPATVVIPVDFARLPVISLVGILLYGEAIDLFVILGAVIICVANYINISAEIRTQAK